MGEGAARGRGASQPRSASLSPCERDRGSPIVLHFWPRHAAGARSDEKDRPKMPKTMFDKIWDSHLVARRLDGRDLIYIDRHVLHELHAPHAFEKLEKQQRPVRRPDLTFSVQDHTIATKPRRDDTTNPSGPAFLRAMPAGRRKNGHRYF